MRVQVVPTDRRWVRIELLLAYKYAGNGKRHFGVPIEAGRNAGTRRRARGSLVEVPRRQIFPL